MGDEEFGWTHRIDATLHLSYNDVEKVGVKLPLRQGDGCIRVLGRFCVLISALFFSQAGSFAETAKVESFEIGENGEMTKAKCVVKFTEVRKAKRIHSTQRDDTTDVFLFLLLGSCPPFRSQLHTERYTSVDQIRRRISFRHNE